MVGKTMLHPPAPEHEAAFEPSFGQRVLLTVDTEEEFDWDAPFCATGYGLDHVPAIARFQNFCEEIDVCPLYLVDWPIVQSEQAIALIGEAISRGKAEVGVQLHPWVNPPHDEEVATHNSFAGNLDPQLETAKFNTLRDAIEEKFGTKPLIYRAGRYGLGPNSAAMLADAGIAIDTSVRSNYDYSNRHGPDYSRHPLKPYWVDAERSLIELPVTTVYWGVLRQQAALLEPLTKKFPVLGSVLARSGMLEKIPLTPEGVTATEALRGIDIAIDDGLPVIVLSFHSPSLAVGHTPYVRSQADLEALYSWFETVYTYLGQRGVKPTNVAQILSAISK